jgi:acetylornithine deacetylase/succinyl-diaminopimelate desuccinylase-like protein
MRKIARLLLGCSVWLAVLPQWGRALDWNRVGDEAVGRLEAYLRVDTTNPPGNETPAAELLQGWLAEEGIEARLYDPMGDPSRKALLARLPGRSERSIVLMSHSDVVPAVAGEWSQPPFAANTVDGVLYGRGVLDTKGLGILQLMTLSLLRRQGIVPHNTLLLLIEPDEEDRSLGIQGMLQKHADLFRDVRMVLNEGGFGARDILNPGQTLFFVQTAEKGAAWMKLTATGDTGHGSVPLANNAVVTMARALDRISRYETPIRPPRSVVELFRTLAEQMSFPNSFVMRHVDNRLVQWLFHGRLVERPMISALLRSSISLTGVHGGYKTNVIPSQVEATLDCRVTVGDSGEALRRELERVVGDPRVRIELISDGKPNESPLDEDLMNAMRVVTGEHVPGSLVAPFMSSGATDSAPFRERGIPAYGVNPLILNEKELASMHGIDERVPVATFRQAVRMYYEIVLQLVR